MSYIDLPENKVHRLVEMKTIGIFFDNGSSHNGLLQQVVQKLVEAGFASEDEIKGEWLTLLKTEREKT